MKFKNILVVFALLIITSVFSVVYAQNSEVSLSDGTDINVNAQANINRNQNAQGNQATTSNREASSTKTKWNATSTEAKDNHASTTTSTTTNAQGKLMSEEHRSTVGTFVQSLLDVANREGGIGAQVRLVAKSQNDSATTTVLAIAKVEDRSSFRTFFFGSDYKDLGVIRSEMVKTSNNIAKLKSLLDLATNTTDQTELNVQIKALEAEQVKLNAYVTAHENYFSLFGWAIRPFTR